MTYPSNVLDLTPIPMIDLMLKNDVFYICFTKFSVFFFEKYQRKSFGGKKNVRGKVSAEKKCLESLEGDG